MKTRKFGLVMAVPLFMMSVNASDWDTLKGLEGQVIQLNKDFKIKLEDIKTISAKYKSLQDQVKTAEQDGQQLAHDAVESAIAAAANFFKSPFSTMSGIINNYGEIEARINAFSQQLNEKCDNIDEARFSANETMKILKTIGAELNGIAIKNKQLLGKVFECLKNDKDMYIRWKFEKTGAPVDDLKDDAGFTEDSSHLHNLFCAYVRAWRITNDNLEHSYLEGLMQDSHRNADNYFKYMSKKYATSM